MTDFESPDSRSDATELPFHLLQNRYEMISSIGSGGMGSVFLAHDPILSREVAIKLLAWDVQPTPDQVQRMQREAQALARLKHPNVLNIWDFVVDEENRPFLIMELIQGESLDSFLKNKGPFSPYDAVAIAVQISEGMSHAHSEELLHRDLKPSNIILVDSEDELAIKIIDLGLAKFSNQDQVLTKTGVALGSPPYMSPEQARGLPLDPTSDIYSLGCVLFAMLTGVPPFVGATAIETISMHLSETPPRLSEALPDAQFADTLETTVARCLSKEREQRFQSMEELRDALLELMAGDDLTEPTSVEETVNGTSSETRKPLMILLATIVVGCAGLAVLWFGYLQPPQPIKEVHKVHKVHDGVLAGPKVEGYSDYARKPFHEWQSLRIFGDKGLSEAADKKEKGFACIRFEGEGITGKGLKLFKDEPIDYVYVAKSALNDEGAQQLSQVKSVRLLDMAECNDVSETAFINLLKSLDKLESLTFGNINTTVESFKAISKHPKLISVNIRSRLKPLPKGFGLALCNSKKLHHIALDICKDLDESAIKELNSIARLETFGVKTQKISKSFARALLTLPTTKYFFEEASFDPGALTVLASKKGVLLKVDPSSKVPRGEVMLLQSRGILQ